MDWIVSACYSYHNSFINSDILKGTGDESDSDAEGGLDLMQHMNGESESDEFSGSDEDDDGGLSGGFGIGDDGGADESQDEGQFEQELDFEDQSSGESEGDPDMDEGKAEYPFNSYFFFFFFLKFFPDKRKTKEILKVNLSLRKVFLGLCFRLRLNFLARHLW